MEKNDIVLLQKQIEINPSDLIVYKSDIKELAEQEMDSACHNDFREDYPSLLDYYLSNVKRDDYREVIKDKFSKYDLVNETIEEIRGIVMDYITKNTKEEEI